MTESRLQSTCYQWYHETFIHFRGLLCYNLNNSRNRVQGAMDKGMGLQKGRSDMVLYYSGKAYHIELKLEGEKQTPDQNVWQKTVETNGFTYKLIYSLEEFKIYIKGVIIT